MVGFDFGSEISVHHIDRNKLNNSISNLQVLRKELHTKEHDLIRFVNKDKLRNNAMNGAEARKRKDITKEIVEKLRSDGYTIPQIAKKLNCGYNTVCRRLGMKDY